MPVIICLNIYVILVFSPHLKSGCLMQDTSCHYLLRDIYGDLIQRLVDLCSEDNIFASQPCRDNTLYLLKLVDEMLISEIDHELLVCIFYWHLSF